MYIFYVNITLSIELLCGVSLPISGKNSQGTICYYFKQNTKETFILLQNQKLVNNHIC